MRASVFISLAALALAVSPGFSPAAQAKITKFSVSLSGAQETPPHAVKGKGFGTVAYDDKTHDLSWKISFSGLTGDATMAHFHGPAKPGVAAGVEVALGDGGGPLTSPIIGSATLSDTQAKDLLAGLFYVNIHTAANPKGEIRGQVWKIGHHGSVKSAAATKSMGGSMKGMDDMGDMKMAGPPKQ